MRENIYPKREGPIIQNPGKIRASFTTFVTEARHVRHAHWTLTICSLGGGGAQAPSCSNRTEQAQVAPSSVAVAIKGKSHMGSPLA
jgi:hypothetical protein